MPLVLGGCGGCCNCPCGNALPAAFQAIDPLNGRVVGVLSRERPGLPWYGTVNPEWRRWSRFARIPQASRVYAGRAGAPTHAAPYDLQSPRFEVRLVCEARKATDPTPGGATECDPQNRGHKLRLHYRRHERLRAAGEDGWEKPWLTAPQLFHPYPCCCHPPTFGSVFNSNVGDQQLGELVGPPPDALPLPPTGSRYAGVPFLVKGDVGAGHDDPFCGCELLSPAEGCRGLPPWPAKTPDAPGYRPPLTYRATLTLTGVPTAVEVAWHANPSAGPGETGGGFAARVTARQTVTLTGWLVGDGCLPPLGGELSGPFAGTSYDRLVWAHTDSPAGGEGTDEDEAPLAELAIPAAVGVNMLASLVTPRTLTPTPDGRFEVNAGLVGSLGPNALRYASNVTDPLSPARAGEGPNVGGVGFVKQLLRGAGPFGPFPAGPVPAQYVVTDEDTATGFAVFFGLGRFFHAAALQLSPYRFRGEFTKAGAGGDAVPDDQWLVPLGAVLEIEETTGCNGYSGPDPDTDTDTDVGVEAVAPPAFGPEDFG